MITITSRQLRHASQLASQLESLQEALKNVEGITHQLEDGVRVDVPADLVRKSIETQIAATRAKLAEVGIEVVLALEIASGQPARALGSFTVREPLPTVTVAPPPRYRMTDKTEQPYEAFLKAGWADSALIRHGYMIQIDATARGSDKTSPGLERPDHSVTTRSVIRRYSQPD